MTVKMDPRVRTSKQGLSQQFTLSKQIYDDLSAGNAALEEIRAARQQLQQRGATDLDKSALALEGEPMTRGNRGAAPVPDTFITVNGSLTAL